MGKIIKFVIGFALAFVAWKHGLPWLQSYGFTVPGAPGEVNTEGWACVRQVEDVHELCSEILSRARPGEPPQFIDKLRSDLEDARILCQCSNRGCAEGNEAIAFLSEMTTLLGDPGRVGEAALQAARHNEKIDGILERAKAAVRSAK